MKVCLLPLFESEDQGDGGIRRIVEAQLRYMPALGVEFVNSVAEADLVAVHAGAELNLPTDKPLVAHCHGLYWAEYTWPSWAHYLNKKVIESIRTADIVTVPSEWVANAIRRGAWIDPVVLNHGIDPEQWEVGENHGYVLWNKTRVDPVCDPEPLDSLAKVATKYKFISTFGNKQSNVTITGRVPFEEAKKYIQNAGVYLCTTRETFGIGTLEAMACGVPILGWNWGGQAEFIKHRETGWLSTPGDFNDLVQGLDYCFANRDKLGSAAREFVMQNYTWEEQMPKYYEVYERVLQQRPTTKVSVVIPCYNLAKYLPDAINSVLQQDYDNYEVVVVNDASPDNTREIAEQFVALDDRIKLINNETNQYLAGALNTGIRAAKGEYIIPLDADNMLGKGAVRKLSTALDLTRDLDIVYGSMELIEPDGKRWVSSWPPKSFDYKAQMAHKNQCPSTSMYRKRVWARVGGYRTRCKTAEDADFWCRVTSFGAVPKKVTDDVTLIYRNRHDSMSHVNKDWSWNKWYPWFDNERLSPYTAPVQHPLISSYEPPLISIIIPVGPGHNKYLQDAIDSIVAQTFTRYEVIVVNDSGEPLQWVPPYIKVIETKGAQGPAVARNAGIKLSKAPLFLPLDADDFLQPDALQLLFETWNSRGGYVYSDWVAYETNETKLTPNYRCEDVLRKLPHAVTALYPKQAWNEIGGFDEKLDAWEDWDFVIALNAAGYCGVRVAQNLFYYRMTTGYRREEMVAKKELAKTQIVNKWGKYILRGEPLMACGGCPKGGKNTKRNTILPVGNETVVIEYLRDDGPITYRGPKTGVNYRFGIGHKIKSVNRGDAEVLLARKEFRLVSKNELEFVR